MTHTVGGRVGAGFLLLVTTLVFGAFVPTSATAQSGAMQRILYGEVLSAEPVMIEQRSSGRGAATGSTVGAIAGAAIARRGDGLLGALVGGAIGGAVGRAADRAGSSKRGTELIIRLESGEETAIKLAGEQEYFPGDRVRLVISPNGATEVRRVRG